MSEELSDPLVSIDRASKTYACFDGFKLLKPFAPYADEATALDDGCSFLALLSSIPPRIVYPRITSIKISR